jgi:hypothetical protein
MCDYCDCRSLSPIAALSADHEYLLEQAARVQEALAKDDAARARSAFDALRARLRAHTDAEERGLFAELRAEVSMVDHVERLQSEHDYLWAAIDALDPASAQWPAAAIAIVDELRAHVWTEEYDIFPASVVGLSSDGWNRVIGTAGTRTTEEV